MLELLVRVILLIVTLLFLAYVGWESSSFVRTIEAIPGPNKLPIFGNYLQLPREKILQVIQDRWVKEYGRIYRIWFGFQTFVNISSPPLIEKLQSSQKFVYKGDSYEIARPWLGDGPRIRGEMEAESPIINICHFQILDGFFDVFNDNANILCAQLLVENDGIDGAEIDVFPFLKRCTLDIVCGT